MNFKSLKPVCESSWILYDKLRRILTLFFVLLWFFLNSFFPFNFPAGYSEEEDSLASKRKPVVNCSIKFFDDLFANTQTWALTIAVIVLLKNCHPFVKRFALAQDANLELSSESIIWAINLGFFVVCCICNRISNQVVTYLDDSHLISEQLAGHWVKMIKFDFDIALFCKEVVSHKYI